MTRSVVFISFSSLTDLDENILKRCTKLFTLRNGAVSEQGTFDDLLEKKGYFYSLFTVSQQ
ncbi:MAG: hypothetical protein II643_00290 [Oscillospiraceae bacterium]|nr:hypothetical protein [Oscillospiraceae bacterium]MBQ4239610.1 hypothetical protein [Oscillospiraceae bacterium]